jgi:hypothetical protein
MFNELTSQPRYFRDSHAKYLSLQHEQQITRDLMLEISLGVGING